MTEGYLYTSKRRRNDVLLRGAKKQSSARNFIIGAYDIETEGLDGKFLLAQTFIEGDDDAIIHYTIEGMLEYIFALPSKKLSKIIWFAHNHNYDFRYIIDKFQKFSKKYRFQALERAGGNIFEIQIFDTDDNLVTKFRDSMTLWPKNLKSFLQWFSPEYEKLDIGLSEGVTFDVNNALHLEYAKRDVIGLVHAIIAFDKLLYDTFGIHCKSTLSSSSLEAWKRTVPIDSTYKRLSLLDEHFVRICYYGGLVQLNCLYNTTYPKVDIYDINSSYPSVMREGIPKGPSIPTDTFVSDCPGFYKIKFSCPNDFVMPILPVRDERNMLSWPVGEHTTYVTDLEVKHALQYGYSIEILTGLYFPEGLQFCFNKFVDTCENMRTEYKDTSVEIVVKLIQNSLYGKFGMKPDGREIIIAFDLDGLDGWTPFTDPETGDFIAHVFFRPSVRNACSMLPHYSAYITARARIKLDEVCRKVGIQNVLYRDTDSMHLISQKDINEPFIGPGYGQFKLEKTLYNARYHAPKCITAFDRNNEFIYVYKGIPKNYPLSEDEKRLLHEGFPLQVTYHSSASIYTYLKGKSLKGISRIRQTTDPDNIHGHVIIDGKFRPKGYSI